MELYYGAFKGLDALSTGDVESMQVAERLEGNTFTYSCSLDCQISGRFGFSVRVVPRGDQWLKFTPGLICWAEE